MGGIAKAVSSTTTYPMAVVRARLFQTTNSTTKNKYAGVTDCAKTMFRKEGIRGFYKGLSAGLMKTVPGSALTFMFYENIVWFLGGEGIR